MRNLRLLLLALATAAPSASAEWSRKQNEIKSKLKEEKSDALDIQPTANHFISIDIGLHNYIYHVLIRPFLWHIMNVLLFHLDLPILAAIWIVFTESSEYNFYFFVSHSINGTNSNAVRCYFLLALTPSFYTAPYVFLWKEMKYQRRKCESEVKRDYSIVATSHNRIYTAKRQRRFGRNSIATAASRASAE